MKQSHGLAKFIHYASFLTGQKIANQSRSFKNLERQSSFQAVIGTSFWTLTILVQSLKTLAVKQTFQSFIIKQFVDDQSCRKSGCKHWRYEEMFFFSGHMTDFMFYRKLNLSLQRKLKILTLTSAQVLLQILPATLVRRALLVLIKTVTARALTLTVDKKAWPLTKQKSVVSSTIANALVHRRCVNLHPRRFTLINSM